MEHKIIIYHSIPGHPNVYAFKVKIVLFTFTAKRKSKAEEIDICCWPMELCLSKSALYAFSLTLSLCDVSCIVHRCLIIYQPFPWSSKWRNFFWGQQMSGDDGKEKPWRQECTQQQDKPLHCMVAGTRMSPTHGRSAKKPSFVFAEIGPSQKGTSSLLNHRMNIDCSTCAYTLSLTWSNMPFMHTCILKIWTIITKIHMYSTFLKSKLLQTENTEQ